MKIIPWHRLPLLLRDAGLDPDTRELPASDNLQRLTVRERNPLPFTGGPHRKRILPDGRIEGPFPVADRPALSGFLAAIFSALEISSVLAAVPEGALWLNSKAQSAYLRKVPDAQKVSLFLRRRGLTDRFQGGFLIQQPQFASVLPMLAANTYSGGSDVLFAALNSPACRLTALACHHFDLHFTTINPAVLQTIADLAPSHQLEAETLAFPDFTESSLYWDTAP